jgi:hypothetical protein
MAQVLEQALMTVPLHFGGATLTGDEDATRLSKEYYRCGQGDRPWRI